MRQRRMLRKLIKQRQEGLFVCMFVSSKDLTLTLRSEQCRYLGEKHYKQRKQHMQRP